MSSIYCIYPPFWLRFLLVAGGSSVPAFCRRGLGSRGGWTGIEFREEVGIARSDSDSSKDESSPACDYGSMGTIYRRLKTSTSTQ